MNLPIAAAGAVVAALLETSVLTDLRVADVKPDLVFVLAIAAVMIMGLEDGLVWAFLGGVILDVLLPERAPGTTSLVLLGCVGLAAGAGRLAPEHRVAAAVITTFVLAFVYHLGTYLMLTVTTGMDAPPPPPLELLRIAVFDLVVAVVAAAVMRALMLRFGGERAEW